MTEVKAIAVSCIVNIIFAFYYVHEWIAAWYCYANCLSPRTLFDDSPPEKAVVYCEDRYGSCPSADPTNCRVKPSILARLMQERAMQ